MKKIIVGVIVTVMIASFAGCSDKKSETERNSKKQVESVKETEAEEEIENETEKETESETVIELETESSRMIEEYEEIRTLKLTGVDGNPLSVTEYDIDEEYISLYVGTVISNNREIQFRFEGPSNLTEDGEVFDSNFCIRNAEDSRALFFYFENFLMEGETIDEEKIAQKMDELKGMTNDELKTALEIGGMVDIVVDDDMVEVFFENYATANDPYCGYSVSQIKMYEGIGFEATYVEYVSSYNDEDVLKIFDTLIFE